ncbi:MAG: lysophospholipid acyltransferase family protein [Gemmataceae bacterium]
MKIRNPRLLAAVGWAATRAVRGLVGSLRVRHQPLGSSAAPDDAAPGDRFIYSIWHENLLLPTVRFGGPSLAVLVSQHRDGQLLGSLIASLGMGMVCGSTTRGGVAAVRQLVSADAPFRHLAVTPDGPRGPRRVVQQGLVYVASRTGMRVVPVGVGYRRPWRLGSWDRFAVPRPFTAARCVTGDPIAVPPGLRADQLELYRLRIQAEMDRLNAAAEAWAETGRLDLPPAEEASLRLAS